MRIPADVPVKFDPSYTRADPPTLNTRPLKNVKKYIVIAIQLPLTILRLRADISAPIGAGSTRKHNHHNINDGDIRIFLALRDHLVELGLGPPGNDGVKKFRARVCDYVVDFIWL